MVLWVFGYASLVWNPGFEYDEKIIGYIKGYRRVFNLACIDHRGTPERPARACTLEAVEGAVCWGAAYCVKGGVEKERAAMEYLEGRECEYDLKISVDFYKEEGLTPTVTGVLVQIAHARGPCGDNREYLFSLEKAMYNIGHEDDHVIELANEVRKVLARPREKKKISSPVAHLLHKPQYALIHPQPLTETTIALDA